MNGGLLVPAFRKVWAERAERSNSAKGDDPIAKN